MHGDVTVQEVMDREFLGVSESDGVVEAVELMLAEGAENVVVLRGTEAIGVVTERDVLRQVVDGDPAEATVGDAMTEGALTVDPDVSLAEAADKMSARATKRLLVTDADEPVGVLTEHDVLSTSPFGSAVDAAATVGEAPMSDATAAEEQTAAASGVEMAPPTDREAEFDDQSICEACGALAPYLSSFNGQLLCADCRDI
jgi:CBS domain-containing protein